MNKRILLSLLLLLNFLNASATTWDEPWADEVIRKADYFVLADIVSCDEEQGIKISIVRQLGGEPLPAELEITNFYMLDLMSWSGDHGAEFSFKNVKQSYFFIKKDSTNNYCISTPTSGFDVIIDSNVYATYRHSYHQALVPMDVYEMSMIAIFNQYHGINYNDGTIRQFIGEQLSKKPAGFEEDEISTFFLQHVSLELIFHLKLDDFYNQILPFFHDTSNFHNRVSASRALVAYNNLETVNLLLAKISSNDQDDFTTVICVWTLKEFHPVDRKKELKKLLKRASTEPTGFGGNIMDPRVATHFPSVKGSLQNLIDSL